MGIYGVSHSEVIGWTAVKNTKDAWYIRKDGEWLRIYNENSMAIDFNLQSGRGYISLYAKNPPNDKNGWTGNDIIYGYLVTL